MSVRRRTSPAALAAPVLSLALFSLAVLSPGVLSLAGPAFAQTAGAEASSPPDQLQPQPAPQPSPYARGAVPE